MERIQSAYRVVINGKTADIEFRRSLSLQSPRERMTLMDGLMRCSFPEPLDPEASKPQAIGEPTFA